MPDRVSLDRRITIQSATVVQNAIGEETETWADFAADLPAQYLPVTGREQFEANQQLATAIARFRVRHRTDLNREMRLVFDSVTWNITHFEEDRRYDRRQYLMITAKQDRAT